MCPPGTLGAVHAPPSSWAPSVADPLLHCERCVNGAGVRGVTDLAGWAADDLGGRGWHVDGEPAVAAVLLDSVDAARDLADRVPVTDPRAGPVAVLRSCGR